MQYNQEKALYIYNWLVQKGISPKGACGILANMYAESEGEFNPKNLQNTYNQKFGMTDEEYTSAVDSGEYSNFVHDSAGYGLCQWTFWSRKQALLEYAHNSGRSIGDLDMQLEFFLAEIQQKKTLYASLLEGKLSATDYAVEIMLQYERPADMSEKNQNKRAGYAEEIRKTLFSHNTKKPIIALDAGHGMNTAGKRCLKSLDPNETREWWLNDRIMDKVESILKAQYDCTVIRVDDTTGVKDISLSERVKTANNAKADVYISMHHNAGLFGRNGGGTVVYYCSSAPERQKQAQALYDTVVAHTWLTGNRSQHIVKKSFYVIKNTTMPAFLVENGFMDSPTDVPVILSEDFACKTAEGVVEFLTTEFSVKKKADVDPSEPVEVSTPMERTYTVKKGDSLWRIATYELGSGNRYKEIMELSGLESNVIHVGQVLTLPIS